MKLSFHRRIRASLQAIWQRITKQRTINRKEPEALEDPHAYVTAPRKPRTPNRTTAAVAEWPEE